MNTLPAALRPFASVITGHDYDTARYHCASLTLSGDIHTVCQGNTLPELARNIALKLGGKPVQSLKGEYVTRKHDSTKVYRVSEYFADTRRWHLVDVNDATGNGIQVRSGTILFPATY